MKMMSKGSIVPWIEGLIRAEEDDPEAANQDL